MLIMDFKDVVELFSNDAFFQISSWRRSVRKEGKTAEIILANLGKKESQRLKEMGWVKSRDREINFQTVTFAIDN